MENSVHLTGVILAGGRSLRMGEDKSFLPFKGETFIEILIRVLSSVTDDLVISANIPEYKNLQLPVISDLVTNQGPAGAIISVFEKTNSDSILVVPCDMPLVTESVLQQLIDGSQKNCDVTLPHFDNHHHPFPGIYNKSCLETFSNCVDNGVFKIKQILEDLHVQSFKPKGKAEDEFKEALTNVNTPMDYSSVVYGL